MGIYLETGTINWGLLAFEKTRAESNHQTTYSEASQATLTTKVEESQKLFEKRISFTPIEALDIFEQVVELALRNQSSVFPFDARVYADVYAHYFRQAEKLHREVTAILNQLLDDRDKFEQLAIVTISTHEVKRLAALAHLWTSKHKIRPDYI